MRVSALRLSFCLGLASSVPASAADGARVQLDVAASCERMDVALLERLLDIEARRRSDAQGARVEIRCSGDIVTLQVVLPTEGSRPRSRELTAADTSGDVGARVLSLAAIELIDEPVKPPAPVVTAPPAPEPSAPPLQPAPSRPRFEPSVRLMASGAVQSIGLESPLAGGGISVDYLRLAPLGLRLEFDVALGSRNYELGTTALRLTTLSAQAGYMAVHDTWTARAMLGYRFGAGRIAGESAPQNGSRVGTVAGAYGGPLLSSGIGLRASSFVAELAAEAGIVSFPLRGDVEGAAAVELDGYWLGLSINVGALL